MIIAIEYSISVYCRGRRKLLYTIRLRFTYIYGTPWTDRRSLVSCVESARFPRGGACLVSDPRTRSLAPPPPPPHRRPDHGRRPRPRRQGCVRQARPGAMQASNGAALYISTCCRANAVASKMRRPATGFSVRLASWKWRGASNTLVF
uniref:Uncharacterized protein n=1 Tax=Setaria italica TaxID=4555 RepID=K3ZXT8_SETIT